MIQPRWKKMGKLVDWRSPLLLIGCALFLLIAALLWGVPLPLP